jgi:hypothetical protein
MRRSLKSKYRSWSRSRSGSWSWLRSWSGSGSWSRSRSGWKSETGGLTDKAWKDAQKLPGNWFGSIESFGVLK